MKYVIIGNGVAGTTAAEQIRRIDLGSDITIISDEEFPFYSRIKLIDYLAGTVEPEDIIIKNQQWHSDNKIDLVLNDPALDIDKTKKQVTTKGGRIFSYDKLLLATGANAFLPPIPGSVIQGVFTLRRMKDAIAIKDYSKEGKKNIVIIGGGVLGLEVGNALLNSGHKITVVEALPRLLPRQMDPDGSEILKKQLENMGLKFHIGHMTKEIVGSERVEGIILHDETKIECDMIIVSAGIRPELTLAEKLGLEIDKGVIVNDQLGTDLPDVYCAGDLVNHHGRLYGIWPASQKQGKVAGNNMAGQYEMYKGTTMSNTLKVAGIDLVSMGEIDADGKFESIVEKDYANYTYRKLVLKNDRIIGAILYGNKNGWVKIQEAIENKKDIGDIKQELEKWNFNNL